MPRFILCAVVAGTLSAALEGCATAPSEANVGPYPAAYREIARDYVRATFLDPYSIRDARIAQPKMGAIIIEGTLRHDPGWTVCVRANAKNRMGAYTGIKDTVLLMRDGRVVASLSDTPDHYDIRTNCADAKYERFAEVEEQPRGR
jgi:hypothetical protein